MADSLLVRLSEPSLSSMNQIASADCMSNAPGMKLNWRNADTCAWIRKIDWSPIHSKRTGIKSYVHLPRLKSNTSSAGNRTVRSSTRNSGCNYGTGSGFSATLARSRNRRPRSEADDPLARGGCHDASRRTDHAACALSGSWAVRWSGATWRELILSIFPWRLLRRGTPKGDSSAQAEPGR
jgi:hypothetical protein